jgi:rod shape-determining protein MreD
MLTLLGQRIDQGARRFLPLLSTMLLMLVSIIAWPLPYVGEIKPSLGLIAVYYWSIHRPDLFRPLGVFALGVLHDAIHFLPLGLTAFIYVAVHQLVLSQRRFFVGHAFFMLWLGFALIMLIVTVGHWLILSALHSQWMTFLPILVQGAITIAVFPLPVWALIYIQRTLLSQI